MAKQKGRLMLVRIGDGEVSETFTVLCGLTSKTLTINNEEFDVTTANCDTPGGPLWAEVMDGVKRVAVSGNGFFKDDEAELRLKTVAMASPPVANFQIVVPDFGTFAGAFFLSSVDYGGEQSGGVTYSLSLASTGAVAFTAIS